LDGTHNGGCALAGAKRSAEQPVAAAECYRPDPVFEMIVVDGQLAIIEVTDRGRPTSQAVLDRFPCRRAIRDLARAGGWATASRLLPPVLIVGVAAVAGHRRPVSVRAFARFAFDLVQRGEVPQTLFCNIAPMIGVQIMEFPAGVSHAADPDHTALEQRLVAGVVVADQLAGLVSEELASMHAAAALRKVIDDGLKIE
jgi:hypothetical protein